MSASQTPPSDPDPRSAGRKLLWFVALWAMGVGTVALISLVLRFWIGSR